MCTNSRLVNSLECYMDELVDCFEDFVTKTLVILSLAIGVAIVMVAYALKLNRNLFDALPTGQTTSDSYQPEPGGFRSSEAITMNYAPSNQSTMEMMDSPNSDPYLQNVHNEKIRQSRSNAKLKAPHGVNMSYVTGKSQNLNSDGTNSHDVNKLFVKDKSRSNAIPKAAHGVNTSYIKNESQNFNSDGANSHDVDKFFVKNKFRSNTIPKASNGVKTSYVSNESQNLNSDGANSHDVNKFFVKNKSRSNAIPKASNGVNTSYVMNESQNSNSDGTNSYDVNKFFVKNKSRSNAIPKASNGVKTSYVTNESQDSNSDGAISHNVNMSFNKNESDVANDIPWKTGAGVPSLEESLITSVGLSGCSANCSRRSLKRCNSTPNRSSVCDPAVLSPYTTEGFVLLDVLC